MQLTEYERNALEKARKVGADLAAYANVNGLPGMYQEAINLQRAAQYLVKEVEVADLELAESPF